MTFFLIGQLVYTILISLYIFFFRDAKTSTRVKLIALQLLFYVLILLAISYKFPIDTSIKNIFIMNTGFLFFSELILRYSKYFNKDRKIIREKAALERERERLQEEMNSRQLH
jgi:hypothetical protein